VKNIVLITGATGGLGQGRPVPGGAARSEPHERPDGLPCQPANGNLLASLRVVPVLHTRRLRRGYTALPFPVALGTIAPAR